MCPPLFRLLLEEPELICGYANAYAVLLWQDATGWQARQKRRLIYLFAIASGVLMAILLAGIALMLYAVTGPGHEQGHWLLWSVPVVPLTWALVAGWLLWRAPPVGLLFVHVREQIAQDMALFKSKEAES
ncbi:MAG: hypothetical protein PHF20_06250 [Halothiobacillaceae bacterium]|nr:hypothetical protein [Halothiobacillaceae bacterium]